MAYDPKCEELARYFLRDMAACSVSESMIQELAQEIQDAIECWMIGPKT